MSTGSNIQAQQKTADGDQSIDDVPMFKRKRVIIPLFILVIVVVTAIGIWYMKRCSAISTDDAFVDADRVTVSSKMLGRIGHLSIDEGDTVHKGDTLAILDDTDLKAQLLKAEASVRYLTRSSEVSFINVAKAQDDFSRAQKQYANKIATQEQFNHSENALKMAQAQADMAAAQIATTQADLAIVKTQLGNTILVAPFDGIIAKRWVLEGDVVQPGQAVFSLYNTKSICVNANFEETKIHKIRIGEDVTIRVDALPGKAFSGKVESIGKSTASLFSLIPANNASGNFTKITQRVPVKIELTQQNDGLIPGLSAFVSIKVQ